MTQQFETVKRIVKKQFHLTGKFSKVMLIWKKTHAEIGNYLLKPYIRKWNFNGSRIITCFCIS
jgi:hypothetical protein